MKLNPLLYDNNSIKQILDKPVRIEIGKINFENWQISEINDIINGKVIKCNFANNPPHLPSNFIFQSSTGNVSEISIANIVSVEILNE